MNKAGGYHAVRSGIALFVVLACFGLACRPTVAENVAQVSLPDFELPKLNGEMVSLSDFRGKHPVLLVFFATWCLPCNVEVPQLNKIYREYGPKGLILLAVDVEEPKGQVSEWARKRGVQYPILLDQKGAVVQEYGIYSVPTNVLLTFDGKVAFWHNVLPDGSTLESVLQ